MKMYEVDVLVTGTRREIYHILAESQEAAVNQAMGGLLHGVDENYEPEDHTRELAVELMVDEFNARPKHAWLLEGEK
jgi:hypothetical protein